MTPMLTGMTTQKTQGIPRIRSFIATARKCHTARCVPRLQRSFLLSSFSVFWLSFAGVCRLARSLRAPECVGRSLDGSTLSSLFFHFCEWAAPSVSLETHSFIFRRVVVQCLSLRTSRQRALTICVGSCKNRSEPKRATKTCTSFTLLTSYVFVCFSFYGDVLRLRTWLLFFLFLCR